MNTNELLIAKRGQERLLALGIAGICIILGFLLFLFVPDAPNDGSANIEWMDKKMMLANIGPGVFFALFGAVITVYSIITQAKAGPVAAPASNGGNTAGEAMPQIQYLQKTEADPKEAENLRASYQRDFRIYARLLDQLEKEQPLPVNLRLEVETALTNTRQRLMTEVWDDQWGDFTQFHNWLKRGCPEPPPGNIDAAVRFFQGK